MAVKRKNIRKKAMCFMAVILSWSMAAGMSVQPENYPQNSPVQVPGQVYLAASGEYAGPGRGDIIDVSFSRDNFLWVVTSATRDPDGDSYQIASGEYMIMNNARRINLMVSLAGYDVVEGGRDQVAEVAGDIRLKLTGDLSHEEAEDLLNSPVENLTCEGILRAGGVWTYGFGGTYDSELLPEGDRISDYVLTLQFEVVGVEW